MATNPRQESQCPTPSLPQILMLPPAGTKMREKVCRAGRHVESDVSDSEQQASSSANLSRHEIATATATTASLTRTPSAASSSSNSATSAPLSTLPSSTSHAPQQHAAHEACHEHTNPSNQKSNYQSSQESEDLQPGKPNQHPASLSHSQPSRPFQRQPCTSSSQLHNCASQLPSYRYSLLATPPSRLGDRLGTDRSISHSRSQSPQASPKPGREVISDSNELDRGGRVVTFAENNNDASSSGGGSLSSHALAWDQTCLRISYLVSTMVASPQGPTATAGSGGAVNISGQPKPSGSPHQGTLDPPAAAADPPRKSRVPNFPGLSQEKKQLKIACILYWVSEIDDDTYCVCHPDIEWPPEPTGRHTGRRHTRRHRPRSNPGSDSMSQRSSGSAYSIRSEKDEPHALYCPECHRPAMPTRQMLHDDDEQVHQDDPTAWSTFFNKFKPLHVFTDHSSHRTRDSWQQWDRLYCEPIRPDGPGAPFYITSHMYDAVNRDAPAETSITPDQQAPGHISPPGTPHYPLQAPTACLCTQSQQSLNNQSVPPCPHPCTCTCHRNKPSSNVTSRPTDSVPNFHTLSIISSSSSDSSSSTEAALATVTRRRERETKDRLARAQKLLESSHRK